MLNCPCSEGFGELTAAFAETAVMSPATPPGAVGSALWPSRAGPCERGPGCCPRHCRLAGRREGDKPCCFDAAACSSFVLFLILGAGGSGVGSPWEGPSRCAALWACHRLEVEPCFGTSPRLYLRSGETEAQRGAGDPGACPPSLHPPPPPPLCKGQVRAASSPSSGWHKAAQWCLLGTSWWLWGEQRDFTQRAWLAPRRAP